MKGFFIYSLVNACYEVRLLCRRGATGALSFWLAERGHKVSLIDFTPKHIEIAKQREEENKIKLESIIVGDARELPYNGNSFDLVLLMGPLYHLTEKSDRLKSIQEAYRVLMPNGRIICEVISRYASMTDGFLFGLVNDPEFVPIVQRDIEIGLHKDTSQSQKYFTDGYFHRVEEVASELVECQFLFEELIAVTSFGCTIPDIENKMKDDNYRNILLNTIKSAEATFPGKPGKIAYASSDILPDGSTTDTEIYTINPTGGTPFQLTNNERQDTAPSYSPNGQRIAYQAFDGSDSEIYTIDATGGTFFQVTNNASDDHGPSYSPDGMRIAFNRWDGTDFEIYTVNVTGGGEVQITNNDKDDRGPSYSPNGEKLAYSHVAASDFEIYKISATGGTPVNITHNDQDDLGGSYSPNGRKIAYYRWDENPSGGLNAEIYKIHHNGGTPVRVTNSDSWDVAPSWGSRP